MIVAVRPAAESLMSDLARWTGYIWHLQIASIRQEPITVGTIIVAVVLLVLGYWLSRWLSHVLTRLIFARKPAEPGAAAAIQTLGFYVLFALFAITSLSLVNFPLTAFTIAGGALAIGIGFGSQTVMNNFISGLILHVERPVRIGDFVKVEDTYGTIEHIGARATRIRATDNTQIIVPNSFFLENNVVNFTLTDDIYRSQFSVGVVYGSDTRKVYRLLLQILRENARVLRDHEPRIVFADFGDSSLVFEVYFWVRARSLMEQREIQSELRFRIDELFRAAGIVIAFPQRDVHLDTARPLEVRVLGQPDDAVP